MSIVVISTGGTIASVPDEDAGASPELTAADLVEGVPGLDAVGDLVTHEFSNVPSPHFTVEQMAALHDRLESFDADPAVEGMVVTQGTDILEETAYFVDLLYDGRTPVVFTGAMRNPSLAGPDGPANLLASARVAADPGARGRGALVVFNDRIHAPEHVTKMHSMNVDTFRSPEVGPVGTIAEDRVLWRWSASEERPAYDIDTDRLTNDVAAVTVTADMPAQLLPAPDAVDAVCLAATGAGHIPPSLIDPLATYRDEGIPVVATTRCPEGGLARDTYGFEGSERTLQELGVYYAERNLQKTRIETIVALAADAMDTAFERPTVATEPR